MAWFRPADRVVARVDFDDGTTTFARREADVVPMVREPPALRHPAQALERLMALGLSDGEIDRLVALGAVSAA